MILNGQIVRSMARGPNRARYVRANRGRRSRPIPNIVVRSRMIPVRGIQRQANQLEGTNYYALDGIFGKIGKALGKVGKVAFKIAKIAVPVAAGVFAVKLLAPVAGKGIKAIFKRRPFPQVPVGANPGVPLDSGQGPIVQFNPPAPAYGPQVFNPAVPATYSNAAAPAASSDDASVPVAPGLPGSMPGWVVPVALGGAALLAVTMMKPQRGRA